MDANKFAQDAVMKNIAAGLSPTNHVKTVTGIKGYRLTLATLVRRGLVEVSADAAGRVTLTEKGRRAVERLAV